MTTETKAERKIFRKEDWDYASPAIYEITLELADRRAHLLGEVITDATDGEGLPTAAHTALTALGQAVADEWEGIPRYYPQIQVIGKMVMPEHFHGLLWVHERLPVPLGQVVNGFKVGCNREARRLGALPPVAGQGLAVRVSLAGAEPPPAGLGESAIRATKHHGAGGGLWAEGFNDVILFRRGQLGTMMRYLRDNPLRWAIKHARPDLFRIVRDFTVKGMHFAAIGNPFLLERGRLVQVQCSRSYFAYAREPIPAPGRALAPRTPPEMRIKRDENGTPVVAHSSPEFEEKLATLRGEVAMGAVLVSPCLSDGEKEIARRAYVAHKPLITLQNEGFPAIYKPGGKLFDKTAEGLLLMLAPINWPYSTRKKKVTRFEACALNRIAQLLAGDGAAEINYYGMRPQDTDRLVAEATALASAPNVARAKRAPSITPEGQAKRAPSVPPAVPTKRAPGVPPAGLRPAHPDL